MALKEQLDADLKSAMIAKDTVKLSVVRMLKSAIKYREIELMKPLDDAGVLQVVTAEVKRHKDSVEQYRAGNRQDLVDQEEAEIRILQTWLPEQLSEAALLALVEAAVTSTGAAGPRDMGKVMKALQPEVTGKADGKQVSELVKARLSGK
jgi:uncharacterized protein